MDCVFDVLLLGATPSVALYVDVRANELCKGDIPVRMVYDQLSAGFIL